MTNLLAIETSGSVCGVAISADGILRASVEIMIPNVHDEMLSSCVADALRYASISVQDVHVVAVSSGPGSFTGLRIGASFAKGLCFDGTQKLFAVPSLTSLMHAATEVALLGGFSSIMAVVASHRDLFYVASSPSDHPTHISESSLLTAEAVQQLITSSTLIVGPAATVFQQRPISGLTRLSARFVALAAWRMMTANEAFTDSLTFVPAYQQEFIPRT